MTKTPRISIKEQFKVFEHLKTIASMDGTFCVYSEGWDDDRVAEKFSLNKVQVASIRKKLLGPLKNDNFVPYPRLIERMNELEERMNILQRRLDNIDTAKPKTGMASAFDKAIAAAR